TTCIPDAYRPAPHAYRPARRSPRPGSCTRYEDMTMRTMTPIAALAAFAVSLTAFGGDQRATHAATGATASPPTVPASTVAASVAHQDRCRAQADAPCAHWLPVVALPAPDPDQASLDAYAQAHLAAWESAPDISAIDLPSGPGRTPSDLAALIAR